MTNQAHILIPKPTPETANVIDDKFLYQSKAIPFDSLKVTEVKTSCAKICIEQSASRFRKASDSVRTTPVVRNQFCLLTKKI